MASLRASRSGLMHSTMNDPFLDADDLGETPQDYDLLTSADEDVVLRHSAYMRQSGTYGTTTPPSIMTSESRINEVETDDEPPASFRAAPMANLRVLLRGVLSAKNFKITLILCTLAFAIGCLMSQAEVEEEKHLIGLSAAVPIMLAYDASEVSQLDVTLAAQKLASETAQIALELQGSSSDLPSSAAGNWTKVEDWSAQLDPEHELEEKLEFELHDVHYKTVRVVVTTNSTLPIALELHVLAAGGLAKHQVVIGMAILAMVYTMIIFNLIHHTIAALMGSFVALAALSIIHERPSFETVVSWIDYETVSLLFGMMVIVGVLTDTGFFEWAAVRAYKMANGDYWRLLVLLCILMSILSPFVDSVTTMLLFGPMTIRLCSVMDLDPLPIIIAEVLFANISGTSTAIGDPPNILIVNGFKHTGLINFGSFSAHVAPGVLLCIIGVFILLKRLYREQLKRQPVTRKMREIAIWQMTVSKINAYDGEEAKIVRKKLEEHIKNLKNVVREGKAVGKGNLAEAEYVAEIEGKYVITNKPLLIKSGIVLLIVVFVFFLEAFVELHLSLAWTALIGAVVLLILADVRDINTVFEKVELGTLIYFAGLFVLLKALEELGVVQFIADHTASLIGQFPEGKIRLAVAITLLVWVGGTIGGVIDNIPFTQTMIPVVARLASDDMGLPLTPLVWALVFGCCLGGNATLIGAPANIVAAGLAEQQGYKLTFMHFFRIGFPCCLLTLLISNVYLLVTHVLIPWY